MPLSQLVTNLRWSWHPETRDLFETLDPALWQSCGGDPVKVLGEVSAERLAALAKDRKFVRRLQDAVDDLQEYLTTPRWYQSLGAEAPASIAYFSAEFGITEVLPQYSGGLGILAGDHLKAASDLGVPLIGVGLLYRAGYFAQGLSADGWQLEHYPSLDPHGLPVKLRARGRRLRRGHHRAAARGPHAARARLAGPGRPGAAAAARQRHRGERADRARRHRPALRRRRGPPAAPGDAARHRRRARRPAPGAG